LIASQRAQSEWREDSDLSFPSIEPHDQTCSLVVPQLLREPPSSARPHELLGEQRENFSGYHQRWEESLTETF